MAFSRIGLALARFITTAKAAASMDVENIAVVVWLGVSVVWG